MKLKFITRLIVFLTLALIVVVGVLFAVQNTTRVPLDLLIVSLSERSVALWVLLGFALGGIIGMLTSIAVVWRLRASLMQANRNLRKLQDTQKAA